MDKKIKRKLYNIWFDLKMTWRFTYWELERWWFSRRCKKGWHLLRPEKVKVTTWKNGKTEIIYDNSFLKCAYCNWLFFPTKEEKEAYEKWKRREHEQNQRWLKAIANPKIITTEASAGEKNGRRENPKEK